MTCIRFRSRPTRPEQVAVKPLDCDCWSEVMIDFEGPSNPPDWQRNRYVLTYLDVLSHGVPLDIELPSNPPRDVEHGRKWSSDEDGDGPTMTKVLFFVAWPIVSRWIRENRRAAERIKRVGNPIIIREMCALQRNCLLQVALLRFMLNRIRILCRLRLEDPQDPSDPYRGWAGFLWISYYHGPRTTEEEWVLAVLQRVYGSVEDAFQNMSQVQVEARGYALPKQFA